MQLKEEINIAVIEEFNKSGLKFTMDDISKNLGISKRTLYTIPGTGAGYQRRTHQGY